MRTLLFVCVAWMAAFPLIRARAAVVNVGRFAQVTADQATFGNQSPMVLVDGEKSAIVLHGDTGLTPGFAYLFDLGQAWPVSDIKLYPRQDGCCPERLTNLRVAVHADDGAGNPAAEIWGTDLFTDGSNPGSASGAVVDVDVPSPQTGRWVKISSRADPVPDYALQLVEVEVFADAPESDVNRALGAPARTTQALWGGDSPVRLTDGDRSRQVHGPEIVETSFAYEINLGLEVTLSRIEIWARQDGCCPERLSNYRVSVHKDTNGTPGEVVWSTDLHADSSDPGSFRGAKDVLAATLDPAGDFKGQWIRVSNLADPPTAYPLQIAEIEAYGTIPAGLALLIAEEPSDQTPGLGDLAAFGVAATVINGDTNLLAYQWQRGSTNIPGATNTTYQTPPVTTTDDKAQFRCVISYPGHTNLTTRTANLRVNYALGAFAASNRPLYGGWTISQLVDGNRNNIVHGDVDIPPGFAYEINLGTAVLFEAVDIYPRQDGCCAERFTNLRVSMHADDNGQIGTNVWSVDLFTDGTNPGSSAESLVRLTADQDPDGTFEGQWIRILSLEDPVQNYALQMNEVEVFGTPESTLPVLALSQQPADATTSPGRTATFSVGARLVNGDPALLTYQWQKNGVDIAGATSAEYTTPPLMSTDQNAKYRCIVAYPGTASLTSAEAGLVFDSNYARGSQVFSNRPLWLPGGWNIAMLVDGNRQAVFHGHTAIQPGFADQINMTAEVEIERIVIWARQDGCCPERLTNFRVSVHRDNNGQIGDEVWHVDRFTDGSNPGSAVDSKDELTADLDPSGTFKGQWIRILSLEDPVQDYALQMTELEVFGSIQEPVDGIELQISRVAQGVQITWTSGVLESTMSLPGGWAAVPGATSPLTVQPEDTARYYRTRQ